MDKEKQTNSKKMPLIFKKKRGGILLDKEEIKYIKSERKKLRKQMKEQGLKKREDFELTAASLGLYFDKSRGGLLLWWLKGKALWALLGALLALLFALFLASKVTQMRGHFTINLSNDLMKMGFLLSETEDFENPLPQLLSNPVEGVPCISISSLPKDIDDIDGDHSDRYFAYTFYLKNESEVAVDYDYELSINSESLDLSKATWMMVFHNGKMQFYAEKSYNGGIETIPSRNVTDRGYPNIWLRDVAYNIDQFELVGSRGNFDYYRIVPISFESDEIVTSGTRTDMDENEIDKFTIVAWLEGDDPDCTDELIDGHLGLEMNFKLKNENNYKEEMDVWEEIDYIIDNFFNNLKFLDN